MVRLQKFDFSNIIILSICEHFPPKSNHWKIWLSKPLQWLLNHIGFSIAKSPTCLCEYLVLIRKWLHNDILDFLLGRSYSFFFQFEGLIHFVRAFRILVGETISLNELREFLKELWVFVVMIGLVIVLVKEFTEMIKKRSTFLILYLF